MKSINKSTLGTLLLIAIVGYGIYYTMTSDQKLSECSLSNEAEVIFTNKNIGKSPTVHYKYFVEGKKHKASQILPKYSQRSDFPVGKKIKIIVACQDYDVSMIEPNK